MGKLVLKSLLLFVLFAGLYLYLVDRLSHQYVDPYYPKFTQEAGSLILGVSRSGEDIDPAVVEPTLAESGIALPLINFALFKYQSPYGEVYLEAVKKKLLNQKEPGIFILSVSVGCFAAPNGMSDEEILEMDQKMTIGKLKNFTSFPNYDYIISSYERPLYHAIFQYQFENQISHPNGWNEVVLETPSFTIQESHMKSYKEFNKREYGRIAEEEHISEYRINSFKNTIDYLKERGKVFIVALPADIEMMDLENELWPELTAVISDIAKKKAVPFFGLRGYMEGLPLL